MSEDSIPPDDPSEWGTPEGRHMIDLLWNPPEPPARGPKQRLTLDQVVEAGMAVAAELGVDKLSMRNVASPSRRRRDEPLHLRAGSRRAVRADDRPRLGVRRKPDPDLPWREQVEFHAHEAWAMNERYPWLIRSNLWRMPLGPHVLDVQEDLYRAITLTGLPALDVARVTGLVESHVFGAARSRITDTSVSANTGITADEYWESRSSFWGTYYSEERFPTMTALWNAKAFDQPPGDDDFGLGILLDGVEALIERRR